MKYKVTVSSLVTEIYNIEADNAEHAEELMWEGLKPTDTVWNDAQILDIALMPESNKASE